MRQAALGGGVVGIEGQDLFQADSALVVGIHGAAQPHPGLLVVPIQFEALQKKLAGLGFTAGLVGGDSLF
jgi:hypothetical protein